MESSKGIVLKQMYNSALLKPYIEYANRRANEPDINYRERFNNVPDEKPRIEVVEQSIQKKHFWDILPDELVDRILHCPIETWTYSVSDHKCQTYRSILQTCCRFKMVGFSGKRFLPKSTFNSLGTKLIFQKNFITVNGYRKSWKCGKRNSVNHINVYITGKLVKFA